MNYIFVDFEMNTVDKTNKEVRRKLRDEIIEIGAVVLDADTLQIGATYKSYVKPEFSQCITKKIQDLTGITDNDLQGAPSLKHMIYGFIDWCESFGEEYQVMAWSDNDLTQLMKEVAAKEIPVNEHMQNMFDRWIDFQQSFGEMMHSKHAIGLSKALESIGVDFEGRAHDALWDATNTAKLYQATQTSETFARMKKYLDDAAKPVEHLTSSMGNLFDFARLGIVEAAS